MVGGVKKKLPEHKILVTSIESLIKYKNRSPPKVFKNISYFFQFERKRIFFNFMFDNMVKGLQKTSVFRWY
jgi:hypothetical protein